MSSPILTLQNITYTLGGRPLLDRAMLSLIPGERVCLVGRNGCGKSTLLRLAAGEIQADDGIRFIQPGTKIAFLPQEPDLAGWGTVFDYVVAGLDETAHYKARVMLHALELSGDELCKSLSGGEARRCALAHVLASEPDLLLLDEPTNHLDLPCIAWLERELMALDTAMVIISHDRRFLETVCQSVVWLEQGRTQRLDAGFAHFEAWRDRQQEQATLAAHKLNRQIAREEDWMRYGVTARRKRNVRRVAELAVLREKRRDIAIHQHGTLKLAASTAENTSKIVISAKNLGWHWPTDANEPDASLVHNLDLNITRGDRLGICGANGTGKTTLLRLLTGSLLPQQGEVHLSPSLQMVTLDQQRRVLSGERSVVDILTQGHGEVIQVGQERRHVMGYMKDFLFRPEQARTPVNQLSGGERGRLALACALARPSNLLVLDEPTNDLDLETLDLLQDMLGDYKGTVLLVSHDRDFLDRLATSILLAEGNGQWIEYAGGYSDMLAQRRGKEPEQRQSATTPSLPKAAVSNSAEAFSTRTSRKLGYKEQRELDGLPDAMEKVEYDITLCRKALEDQELYKRDPTRFEKLTALLQERENTLATLEERWLELEARRELL